MEARTTITVTREDILDLIRAKGYDVPDDATINTEDYDETLPLIVSFKMDEQFSVAQMNELRSLERSKRYIESIKRVREYKGWGLAEAKAWVDNNLPNARPPL